MNVLNNGGQSRAITAQGRPFASALPGEILDRIQTGVMRTVYRGVPFYKSPFDIALYLQLLSRLQPQTVIEIGTKAGGSALWFADMMTAAGTERPRIVSVDIAPAAGFDDPRITFLEGDAKRLRDVLPPRLLASLARPWLVVEDSSHFYEEASATLTFFHEYLLPGDYIVVEDGVVSGFTQARYAAYKDGPNRAVADFLEIHSGTYRIDASLCDLFGHNVTYNPNGWLCRV